MICTKHLLYRLLYLLFTIFKPISGLGLQIFPLRIKRKPLFSSVPSILLHWILDKSQTAAAVKFLISRFKFFFFTVRSTPMAFHSNKLHLLEWLFQDTITFPFLNKKHKTADNSQRRRDATCFLPPSREFFEEELV